MGGGCERRIEVIVKMQKRWVEGERGSVGSGVEGRGWCGMGDVYKELKVL